jgi:NADH dehydrogenase (ubiquinone) 1 beta subcomplex subunit 7
MAAEHQIEDSPSTFYSILTFSYSVEMHISQEELNKTQIPLQWRDYCSHLLPALNKCRVDNYYLPWKCEMERIAWQKCQYDE